MGGTVRVSPRAPSPRPPPRRRAAQSAVRPGAPPLRQPFISSARRAAARSRRPGLSVRAPSTAPSPLRAASSPRTPCRRRRRRRPEPRLPLPAPACPRLVTLFVAAGAMRLGPKPAVLGLLILCASAAGSGDAEELHYAQGEHRTDYDREALLGGQVRRPGRGCAAASPPQPPRALSGDKEGRQATLGRPDRGDPGGTSLAL